MLYTIDKRLISLLKNLRQFRTKYSMSSWIVKKNFTSANQSNNQEPHLGIFYSLQIIFINAGHHRGTSYYRKFDMKTIIFLKMC
jgi:hypothetical protein